MSNFYNKLYIELDGHFLKHDLIQRASRGLVKARMTYLNSDQEIV